MFYYLFFIPIHFYSRPLPGLEENCALSCRYAASIGKFLIDVSGQNIGPTFKGQNLTSTLEGGTDRLSWYVGKKITTTRRIITQESAVFIYFAAEAWSHTSRIARPPLPTSIPSASYWLAREVLSFCQCPHTWPYIFPSPMIRIKFWSIILVAKICFSYLL
jgi:uncharacterized membrane protein YgcG